MSGGGRAVAVAAKVLAATAPFLSPTDTEQMRRYTIVARATLGALPRTH